MRLLDISTDLSTTRLVKVVTAAKLAGHLDGDAAKILVNGAKAVRLYAEANANQAAEATLAELFQLMGTADAGPFRQIVEDKLEAVAKAISPRRPVIQSVDGVKVVRAITAA